MNTDHRPLCKKCDNLDMVKKNGHQAACRSRDKSQRFYCTRCKRSLPVEDDQDYAKLKPLRSLRDKDLKGVAMYVIGLRFEDVHRLAEVKQKTIRSKLTKIYNDGLWGELEDKVLAKFPSIRRNQFGQIFELCSEAQRDKRAFSRAGEKRAKDWLKLSEEEQDALYDEALAISRG